MTPAAKALITKNTSLSGLMVANDLPRIGIRTPMAPALRIAAMAINFSVSALALSRASRLVVQSQSPEARSCGKRRKRERRINAAFVAFSMEPNAHQVARGAGSDVMS